MIRASGLSSRTRLSGCKGGAFFPRWSLSETAPFLSKVENGQLRIAIPVACVWSVHCDQAHVVGIPSGESKVAEISMEEMKAHPNTQAVLDAWRRLGEGASNSVGPSTDDYPGLVNRLFVLHYSGDYDFSFRRVGYAMERLFGRQLADHSFLSIWNEPDRRLVGAALAASVADRGPSLIRARGETLTGRRVDIEFALAPLFGRPHQAPRFLGLCQPMSPEELLNGRPLRRLQTIALFPPARPLNPTIRLISSQ
jgi:hypothetical protein